MFIFENVPGMLSAKPGDELVIKRIFDAFDKIDYEILDSNNIKEAKIDASLYGVPQKRNRVLIWMLQLSQYHLCHMY